MKSKYSIYISNDLIERLAKESESSGVTISKIIEQALYARLPERSALSPVVDFLLRPGKPDPKPSWQNGGRWFLDWLLLREPDWQRHHLVTLPRCWPIPYRDRELRCESNCGDPRSLLDHFNELREPYHRDDATFPRDLPDPTLEEWRLTLRLFEGCCGERIRPVDGPHWESVCMS